MSGSRLCPALLIAALAALPSSALPASAQTLKPWRHGILEAKSDAGFIMMAERGGFAAKRGLKIETSQMKAGATVIKALIAGELDSVEMGAAEAIVAGARGADVKIVGCTWPGLPQVVMAKAEIKSPAELKGRTVAISQPGSLPDLLIRAVLDNFQVPVDEVKFASLGADIDRYKAMASGLTDAAVVSSEFQPIAPKEFKVLVEARTVVPYFVRLCISTTGKVLGERRDDTVAFVAAQMDALAFATTHRAETTQLTREMTGAKSDDPRPEFIFDQAIRYKQIDPTLALPLEKIEWMQGQFVKSGVLPKAVETPKLVDASVRVKAAALAGKEVGKEVGK
jgi:NitT/TauT family transport system substrate-binding protein